MASEWYYIIDEMQYGPVSSGELRDLAVRGQLLPSSLVWKEGLEGWVRAKNIKGLIVTSCQKTNKQVSEESNTLNPETELPNVKLHTDPSINIIPEKISGQNSIPVTSENDYQGLDESSDSEERNRENKSKKYIKVVCQVASEVGSYLKAQGVLVIITLVEMPNAYYGYGKSIYHNDRFHSVFSDTFNNISNLESAISEYSTRTSIENSNNKSGYILKKLMHIIILRGKIGSLKMKKRDLFRLLGKQVYESELTCSELEKSAERISALIAKSSSLRIQREEFADSMNNSKGFMRLRRHPWLACISVLLLLSTINSMIDSGKGKYSDTVQETAVKANNMNEVVSSEKPVLYSTSGKLKNIGSDTNSKQNESDSVAKGMRGPNGEKLMIGGNGLNTDWFYHYYLDKSGKKIMHGSGKIRYNGSGIEESVYQVGILIERAIYDSNKKLTCTFKQLKDGNYQKDEFYSDSSGSENLLRSIVSITKTNDGELIKIIKRRWAFSDEISLTTVKGRAMKTNVNTVNYERKASLVKKYNARISSLKCTATEDSLVIDFDFLDAELNPPDIFPLLVRIFDKNGQHLTHFTTAERYTPSPDSFMQFDAVRKRFQSQRAFGEADKYKTMLLKPKANRLIYSVNIRDLKEASVVEVGFTER